MKRGTRGLSDEDRILWHRVARTVKPMPGVVFPAEPDAPPAASAPALSARPEVRGKKDRPGPREAPRRTPDDEPFEPFLPPYVPPVAAPTPHPHLDRPTHGKIARGRLSIEARIDLHGLTQIEAHGRLLSFLRQAHASDLRHVLVITGKGTSKGGDGVLRRAVPGWLATPAFSSLVGAHAAAARHHGGEGALYLRLRRAGAGR